MRKRMKDEVESVESAAGEKIGQARFAAYAEDYFTPVLGPDFDAGEVDRALEAYAKRQRRFGGLGKPEAC